VGWLTQEYLSKNKPTDDLFVVVGLTSPERKDFYYRNLKNTNQNFWYTLWPMRQYKYPQKELNEFSELYTAYMWQPEEYIHRYVNQIFYLQTIFKQYNIKHLFFQAFYPYKDMNIRQWTDNPYSRVYQSQPDRMVWDMIDEKRFVNKNTEPHSFHNYILNRDITPDKSACILDMHPSELGHTWWAEYLHDYIKNNNLW
jgi:hypothetical protein